MLIRGMIPLIIIIIYNIFISFAPPLSLSIESIISWFCVLAEIAILIGNNQIVKLNVRRWCAVATAANQLHQQKQL